MKGKECIVCIFFLSTIARLQNWSYLMLVQSCRTPLSTFLEPVFMNPDFIKGDVSFLGRLRSMYCWILADWERRSWAGENSKLWIYIWTIIWGGRHKITFCNVLSLNLPATKNPRKIALSVFLMIEYWTHSVTFAEWDLEDIPMIKIDRWPNFSEVDLWCMQESFDW